MAPQFSQVDSQLISDLYALSKKAPKLVKSSVYSAPSEPSISVRSWKMDEFKYYDIPSPFPTLARGLFTTQEGSEEDGKDKYRIVARGYDKFFNIGEVPWTNWESITAHTCPPYTVSLKSNGCIIFIAALTATKLLITSKHSLGPVVGVPLSHAQAGEQWLRKYLAAKNNTEEQLAAVLWEHNWTLVSELCDDSFEEHVLGYPPEKTGLHLHGINESTKDFKTLLQDQVDAFADEWGFIKTDSITLNTIEEVRSFTSSVASEGEWRGDAVEGFVVRTHVTDPPTSGETSHTTTTPAKSPYAPGSSFFFKIKFDEPYMMYRDWREVTKMLLTTKEPVSQKKIPKSKMNRAETRVYVKWVVGELERDRAPFEEYTKGKGIIANRERFLQWFASEEGQKALEAEKSGDGRGTASTSNIASSSEFGKTILLPVAIPGCGKTTIAVALAHLYGFGHTQSDDVRAKKPAPIFINNVTNLLKKHDVVIADKNNHLIQHRRELRDAVKNWTPPVRLIALNWSINKPPSTVHRICGDRVKNRGENHQTLRADTERKTYEDVIWRFISNTQELSASEVDATIEMDLEETTDKALRRAIEGCVRVLGVAMPSEEQIKEALRVASEYQVKEKRAAEQKKKDSPRYFGLLADMDLKELLGNRLDESEVPQPIKNFWTELIHKKRLSDRPHITIVHKNSLPDEQLLWDRCATLHMMKAPPLFKITLGNILTDGRVMAATVDDVHLVLPDGEGDQGQEGHEFISKLPEDLRNRLHVTVGTRDNGVPPYEAKGLVERWRKGEVDSEVQSVSLKDVVVQGRVRGLFH